MTINLQDTDTPAASEPITVTDLLCGHLVGEGCDETCAYWRGVALGERPPTDTVALPWQLPGAAVRGEAA
ncbi:hypothetical protein C1I95_25810 [Micromonospora craterilacus]|uniref:Uncharacterized protein n=1 Tax=Micromonospora craterilacus TaxID=1655439 RepID=A0A2W2ESX4_9ACTN|nr:hypothetical protein [Micromonospora craterilacus]PZG12467.1 hypothetical protein C1I95_25810 [Micromonospora craterilacus]